MCACVYVCVCVCVAGGGGLCVYVYVCVRVRDMCVLQLKDADTFENDATVIVNSKIHTGLCGAGIPLNTSQVLFGKFICCQLGCGERLSFYLCIYLFVVDLFLQPRFPRSSPTSD